VTIAAGGSESTVDADAEGRYTATLRLRAGDFDPATMLRVTARGVDAQAHVELTSQVGSVGRVIEQAGDDETLDASEQPRLNATHVSTARYLLASDANGRSAPASDGALRDAEAAIDTTQLLDTAGIVKVLADTQAAAAMPEGETTLTALESDVPAEASNAATLAAFLAGAGFADDAGTYTPELQASLDAAIASTLADATALGRFTPAMPTGSTVWTSPTHPDWVPRLGSVIDFAETDTGVSFEKADNYVEGFFYSEDIASVPEPFSWQLEDSVLRMTYEDYSDTVYDFFVSYDELVTRYGFDQSVADFLTAVEDGGTYVGPQLPIRHDYGERTVTLVSSTPGAAGGPAVMHVRSHVAIEYSLDDLLTALGWTGPLPRAAGSAEYDSIVYAADGVVNALEHVPAAGETWAVPLVYAPVLDVHYAPVEGLYTEMLTLEADGTTSAGLMSGREYAWSAGAEGLVLEAGNERYVYTPVQSSGALYLGLVTHYVDGAVALRHAGLMTRADDSGAALAADLVQELPLYWQAGLNASATHFYRDDGLLDVPWVFGYSFADDGTNARILGSPVAGCLVDDTEPCFTRDATVWSTTISGRTIVRDNLSFSQTRTWEVLSYAPGGRAVVLEWQVEDFFETGEWELFIYPRLNTLEIMDLGAWAPELEDSDLLGE
jgi:hypothetical protein